MAHSKSKIIIGLLLLGALAGAVFAAPSAEDVKSFPAIGGEVSGVTIPGVKSISINDKPVKVNPDNTFFTRVELKAGEKYLILRITYQGLRVIKKYLVLRSEKSKQFKVFVPKAEIETPLKVSRAANRPVKRKTITKEEIERIKREAKAREKAAKVQKESRVYDFSKEEFGQGTETMKGLSTAIVNDNYGMNLKSPIGTLSYLKEILRMTNFYDRYWKPRWGDRPVSAAINNLLKITQGYRGKPFSSLTAEQQMNILKLNRLLLETTYPGLCPISELKKLIIDESWMSEIPLKNNGYIYVWEFSHGKFLVLKVVNQKFSADIYVPLTEEWISLQNLSYKELKELIAKPAWEINSFEEKK
ncbi:hypothetical protein A3K48_04185 [candidate division WOR-1 bacterium RIFOXYA12_FULL_52_29]|uniref:PEGA domain-containing protein n=1 Tax=candidate division WOR-1 bacterium RIFOXYC12_FULL_54_18 TaxID=1802584 RepID=A0A1F4T6M6_UNCSA|nr:MAG: hypothetical protein A3K44_04185 [candidate division WOR-1 bacterium RIFOXYA2_FULL_51_19]OGC17752.1 MAG: hypothetical protein A3K48_04185 [candidate division WOR-1 bacterium RIFOXYA12_FULL_52_29]OGC26609.1 MAG: hypothetical protein A3K32_04180 [candidate division WOR-1 bacterium RIFOXYB2_FULL_45_9]OGC28169.1 MAG: hypothetical protein A3K49_04185 [candidate division WOR-1 bacterium RIFOXYC12_FULL_54_18]OGC29545.1 MAG: hypothetical protein A2346_02150 [candidate division WOR-1 bacterium R